MSCVFCKGDEHGRINPEEESHFLCSKCMQIFLKLSGYQSKELHRLCLDSECEYKAQIIEHFLLIEEEEKENGGQRNSRRPARNVEKHSHRKRSFGIDRLNKKPVSNL